MLASDIFQCIINYHELVDQINLCNLNNYTRKYFKIYLIHKIPVKYKKKLTQKVLQQDKFYNLKTLDVSYDVNVKSVNHLSVSLKLLNILHFNSWIKKSRVCWFCNRSYKH